MHKPGTVPLRPLALGDFFDASFSTIRRNPKATIGMGAAVTVAFLLLPTLVGIVVGASGGGLPSETGSDALSTQIGYFSTVGLTALAAGLAGVVVAGMIVPVVTRACLGEKITAADAWRQSARRIPGLLGLAFLELLLMLVVGVPLTLGAIALFSNESWVLGVLLVIVGVIAILLMIIAVHVKFFLLAAPAVVTERIGVFAGIRRASQLSQGQFWRLTGIMVLVHMVAGFASQILQFPFAILGGVAGSIWTGSGGAITLFVSNSLSVVISGALITPFTSIVAVLFYLDQRFRKEGFDVELINYAQSRRDGN